MSANKRVIDYSGNDWEPEENALLTRLFNQGRHITYIIHRLRRPRHEIVAQMIKINITPPLECTEKAKYAKEPRTHSAHPRAEKQSPIERLYAFYGTNLKLENTRVTLGGKLTSLPELVRNANEILRSQGEPEINYPGVKPIFSS